MSSSDTVSVHERLAREAASVPTVVIEPTHGWRSLGLRELWEFRELLQFMVVRDVKANYRQMAFGPLWIIVQPLVAMVILSFVFGRIARLPSEGVPYPLFVFVALLPWQFFARGTRAAAESLIIQRHVIAKVYFPRLIVPVAALLAMLVDLLASGVILVGMLVFYRVQPGWEIVTLPLFVLLASATALGVGLTLAGLAVKYRDVMIGLGFALTVWQYMTPVAYTSSLVPEEWLWLYRLNPMAVVVEGWRWAVLGTATAPHWTAVVVALLAAVLVVAGAFYFRATERTIVDVL